jgi:hypothetical protein
MPVHCENQQLIRIENSKGIGPFWNSFAIYEFGLPFQELYHADNAKNIAHRRMPGADRDFYDDLEKEHRCAYLSIESFLSYWDDEKALKTYLKCGFNLYRIHVTKCIMSESQAIFLPNDITKREVITFDTIKHYYSKEEKQAA